MIAIPKKPQTKLTRKHQQQFVTTMLPTITRVARQAFSDRDPEAREEAVAEVVAMATIMYAGLVRDGRESLAYPRVLARFGVRRVRIGRQAATPRNVRDASSMFCQLNKGVTVERLVRFDRDEGALQEVLVEDKTAGPAEIAASRIDVGSWMNTLPPRDRRIAQTLATGETTGNVARRFNISPSRISQLRRELLESWSQFIAS